MPDVIELTVRLGETLLEQRYLERGILRIAGVEVDADQRTLAGDPIGSSWVCCKSGLVEVSARRTAPPQRYPLAGAVGDRRSAGYVTTSLAVHLIIWAVASEQPPEATVRIEEPKQIGTRVVGSFPTAATDPFVDDGDSPDLDRDGGGRPTMGIEGRAGGASPREQGHARLLRRDQPAVTLDAAIESARNAGVLGSSSLRGQGFAALVGTADPASGFDSVDTQGPLYGGDREAGGSFGLGRSGSGDGAGCAGGSCGGIIGTGQYGTISNGRSAGDYWGGGGLGAASGRRREVPTVQLCSGPHPCAVALGGLDKELIRRHLRRQIPKIQYCYEKELLAHAELDGTVQTHFMISTDGTVTAAEASGVSEAVSSCVAMVVKNTAFPKFRNSITEVHYPFTFRRLGS